MDAKSRISIGFTLIYALFLVLFALCIGSIVGIQYIKGDVWHDIGKTIKSAMTPRTVEPLRGSIYCYNMEGQKEVVAASMKVYKIFQRSTTACHRERPQGKEQKIQLPRQRSPPRIVAIKLFRRCLCLAIQQYHKQSLQYQKTCPTHIAQHRLSGA